MTRRLVAPWFTQPYAAAAPPGVDPQALGAAMFEDLYDTLCALDLVEAAVLAAPGSLDRLRPLLWPGALCVEVAPPAAVGALSALATLGADTALVVAADAPDLPPLLVGKAMRALGSAEVAYCEATGGGLVFLAARCPMPRWLLSAAPDLDDPGAAAVLARHAPTRALASTPGWHRLRDSADLGRLDPGLEGWEVTRALLAGRPLRQPG
ncbi:MAG TPA: hypothetical protein VFJ14_01920 [Nocardioidaceae bacterium]|nr:hypothetical protein [Nocardioidaceae bacterium]